MIIPDYKSIILDYLQDSDHITHDDILELISDEEEYPEVAKAGFLTAITELVAANVLSLNPLSDASTGKEGSLIWILRRPVSSLTQEVMIDLRLPLTLPML
jgi:hypothetical protein